MQHFKTYHSPIYRGFKSIEVADHRSVVRFFEKHEKAILQLEFKEYFELLIAYTDSLFEIGSFSKHILMSDVVIEASIEQNIQFFHGQDVYYSALFKKAASFYNLYEHNKAEHILTELIKMDPYNSETINFLKKSRHDRKSNFVKNMRATAMVLFLITPVIIAFEVLFVTHFYQYWVGYVRALWMVVFVVGWVCYLSGDFIHKYRETKQIDQLVSESKKRNRNNL